ncbi:hypothetical protein ES702_05111 [subsurface metagenome]
MNEGMRNCVICGIEGYLDCDGCCSAECGNIQLAEYAALGHTHEPCADSSEWTNCPVCQKGAGLKAEVNPHE